MAHPIMVIPQPSAFLGAVSSSKNVYAADDAKDMLRQMSGEDDWSYAMVAHGPGFAIEIKDEDGLFVGWL